MGKATMAVYGPLLIAATMHHTGMCDIWNSYGLSATGGHAMTAVAYNDHGLTIRNSWGTDWCVNGRTSMSWDDAFSKAWQFCWFKKPLHDSMINVDRINAVIN